MLLLGSALSVIHAIPTPDNIGKLISDLKIELANATTAEDSIKILERISDLKDTPQRVEVLSDIYDIAVRTKNYKKACDALRKQANIGKRTDSVLVNLIEKTLSLPESDDRNETEAFIRMTRTSQKLRYGSALDKQVRLNELLERLTTNPPSNIYDNIVLLHAVCSYMSDSSQGELLSKYMDSLGTLVEKLPKEAYSIRNNYYIQAALAYAENDEPEKSIKADKHMLELIDSLEMGYKREGRSYRDFDGNRFVIYSRMLSNFESLTRGEIEEYYAKAKELVKINARAASTYKRSPQIDIYYAMYHKDYSKALNLLKSCIDDDFHKPKKRLLLKHMIKAAKEVGDEKALLKASTDYNNILEDYLDRKYQERYKELQVIYDVHKMKNEYMQLQESKHESENSLNKNGAAA